MEADNLEATVEATNEAAISGEDAFGRTRFGARLAPPYYGVRVTSALVQTLGGLRVDVNARVLRENGEAVPGLFAARRLGDDVVRGLAGARSEGYLAGTGLLAAFGLGWLAARAAASASSAPRA